MKPVRAFLLFVGCLLPKQNSKQKTRSSFSGNQSGQALIIILAFSAILGAGLLSIYNTAQLSTAKRELVNAADASAYSGASILAQGLNYTAYTNRAILANNALIGQMMALRSTLSMSSWYWKNTSTQWKVIQLFTRVMPYIGPVASKISEAFGKFAEYWDKAVVSPVKILAEVMGIASTSAISLTNHALWLGQQLMLADSIAMFEPHMITIAKENAPDATVDWAMYGTAFGPAITIGMAARQFRPKMRKFKRTLGTPDAVKDQYLDYVTEFNRAVYTVPYLGGRTLMPNAVGLWIAKGCNTAKTGLESVALAPAAGLGAGGDVAVRTLEAFAAVLNIFADPIMCLFDRHGGSELVQLKDGKMAWLSIDSMAFKIPLADIYIPMAGGSTMSFTEIGKSKEDLPESVEYFRNYVETKGATKYMGHQPALPADCYEVTNPIDQTLYAASRNGRTSENCAVLATGLGDAANEQGLWGGGLKDTTNKTIDSKAFNKMSQQAVQALTAPLQVVVEAAVNDLKNSLEAAAPPVNAAAGAANPAPPGISGDLNRATHERPDVPALNADAAALRNSAWMKNSFGGVLSALRGRLDLNNFRISASSVLQAATGLDPIPAENMGGVAFWEEVLLKMFGLGDVYNMLAMRVSEGVETPRFPALNTVANLLSDGLPLYFWDVNITDKIQDEKGSAADNLIYTDDKPDDYNSRRYNLGPIVYFPLKQDMDKIKTSANLGIGGEAMGLPDYDQTERRNDMRAMGKARIFFRQPSDHWSSRYRYIMTASLTMPYWQVRSESLSYVDKWGLMVLDGFVTKLYEPTD